MRSAICLITGCALALIIGMLSFSVFGWTGWWLIAFPLGIMLGIAARRTGDWWNHMSRQRDWERRQ